MADTHDLFSAYHDCIRLSDTKEESLRRSRDAVRAVVESYFKETLKISVPTFHGQGSYSMKTVINPLDGEYDIDDGVYLSHLKDDRSTWPKSETVHGWLVDALKDQTNEPPMDKARCVRVRYAGNYHIDLPIYGESGGKPYLFEKKKSPYLSDPAELTAWFSGKVQEHGDQLRRVVRCLKAWRDYQKDGLRVAKGIVLTILAAQNFKAFEKRDDLALAETAGAMADAVQIGLVSKPVEPFENLSAGWTADERQGVVDALRELRDRGRDATSKAAKRSEAAKIWRKQLGERFPSVSADDDGESEKAMKTSAPAILGSHGRSA